MNISNNNSSKKNTTVLNKNWSKSDEKEKVEVKKKITVAVDSISNSIAEKGLSIKHKVKKETFLGIMSEKCALEVLRQILSSSSKKTKHIHPEKFTYISINETF